MLIQVQCLDAIVRANAMRGSQIAESRRILSLIGSESAVQVGGDNQIVVGLVGNGEKLLGHAGHLAGTPVLRKRF
jgi:hypothetical protein